MIHLYLFDYFACLKAKTSMRPAALTNQEANIQPSDRFGLMYGPGNLPTTIVPDAERMGRQALLLLLSAAIKSERLGQKLSRFAAIGLALKHDVLHA